MAIRGKEMQSQNLLNVLANNILYTQFLKTFFNVSKTLLFVSWGPWRPKKQAGNKTQGDHKDEKVLAC